MPVSKVSRKHGISSATYFKWTARYGDLDISELNRTKGLGQELSRLKRLYADLSLENWALKDLIAKKL